MSDIHEFKTLIRLPSERTSMRVGQLIAEPPRANVRTNARKQKGLGQVNVSQQEARTVHRFPEHCVNMKSVVDRLLAEGADVEETLTRVCVALRDMMGWSEVSLWWANGHEHLPPLVSAIASSIFFEVESAPVNTVASADGTRLVEQVFTTGLPASVSDVDGTSGGAIPSSSRMRSRRPRSAFAFPVRGTHDVLGVLECVSRPSHPPDAATLRIAASLGPTIGQFLESQRTTPELGRVSETESTMFSASARWVSRLEAVLEALADSMILFDSDGRILRANAADRAMFGYDAHFHTVNSTLRERGRVLILRDEQKHVIADEQSPLLRILRGESLKGQHAVEAVTRTLDGRDIHVSISGAPIYDDDGIVVGGFAVTRDDTERQQVERALRDTNQHMKEFLAIAAHDLRTPITSSKGYVQLANRRLTSLVGTAQSANPALAGRIEDVRSDLDNAERSAQRLALLVDRLLDVARIQTDKLELRPENANLAEIVRTTVQEQRLAAPTRTILLELPPTLSVPTRADPTRVGQVLMNYLANALKYSSEDSAVKVTLEVHHAEARVAVHDQGSGIPRSQRKRIWSRFEQLAGAPQHGPESGLGLGLYISRAIVEAHGGQVGLKSTVGRGSTFWFSLPLAHRVENRYV